MQKISLNKDPDNPEFVRLPKPNCRCPYTGLSRTTLVELTVPTGRNEHRPPVRSVVLKGRHAVRGIRLIHYQSLVDYLHGLSA